MRRILSSIAVAAVSLAGPVVAHEEPAIRFVSGAGVDSGACATPQTACRSITFAGGAGKAGLVRVAAGHYPVETVDDLYFLLTEDGGLEGGFSDDFDHRDPATHPSVVFGVPVELRASLEARGFEVVVDDKWRGTGAGADPDLLDALMQPMHKSSGPAQCVDGTAGGFGCEAVDLMSKIALGDFTGAPARANDIWGFIDLNSEREYALVGLTNGIAVVDVTDPAAPYEVGLVEGENTSWRDIKVLQWHDHADGRWRAYAYASADGASEHLTVIDLSDLPNGVALLDRTTPDRRAHTLTIAGVDLALNIPLAGREPVLIQAGSNLNNGAFRAFSLADPAAPSLISQASSGYMHDGTAMVLHDPAQVAQCPSAAGGRCEVLADYNETTLDLWDITAPSAPVQLSSTSYANASYVHSGSWSEDGRYVFVHDEFDERDQDLDTQVYVFDATDLSAPKRAATWTGPTAAIDHNGYPRGNRYYFSNYTRGLTVLDITDPTAPGEVGHFDTFPVSDAPSFNGAWGVYPLLPSGTVLISDINSGLFVLRDRTRDVPQGRIGFEAKSVAADYGSTVEVPVTRVGGSAGAASVGWEILHGSAGPDEVAYARGRVDWADGEAATRHIEVPLATGAADLRRFFIRLFDPRGGATLGENSITSVFVEPPGAAASTGFLADRVAANVDAGRALLVVRRQGAASGTHSVDFEAVSGSAVEGTDFAATAGTLSWPDGDATARVIEVPLLDGATRSSEAEFTVKLLDAGGAVATVAIPPEADGPPPQEPPPAEPPPTEPPAEPPSSRSGGGNGGWLLFLAAVAAARRRPVRAAQS